jgi:hypothetical protein
MVVVAAFAARAAGVPLIALGCETIRFQAAMRPRG